ncbi:MAG: D-alanine--D-alanine ligase [Clostridia bacterium]|nr:D-alanine--D-alanine ligase [Clostridia bacterium]
MRKKIALIFGGRSLEHEVSVITAMQILNNLDKKKYAVEPVYMKDGDFFVGGLDKIDAFVNFEREKHGKVILANGEFLLIKRNTVKKYFKPDVAVVACHGGEGEDGTLQALLDFNGIAYTSPGVLQSAVCMDKDFSKQVFESMCLNVLPYETFFKEEFEEDSSKTIFSIESFLAYPLIIKPARLGSSIGIGVAKNREELLEKLEVAFKFDNKVVVETKLEDFVEVNCAAYFDGNAIRVSRTEQPMTDGDFLSFADKYERGGKMSGLERISPANVGSLNLIVQAMTERIYRDFAMNGIVRVDYLVDTKRGKVYINEINTVPGSLAFYLFDVDFKTLLDEVIEVAPMRTYKLKTQFKTEILAKFKGGAKMQK